MGFRVFSIKAQRLGFWVLGEPMKENQPGIDREMDDDRIGQRKDFHNDSES